MYITQLDWVLVSALLFAYSNVLVWCVSYVQHFKKILSRPPEVAEMAEDTRRLSFLVVLSFLMALCDLTEKVKVLSIYFCFFPVYDSREKSRCHLFMFVPFFSAFLLA